MPARLILTATSIIVQELAGGGERGPMKQLTGVRWFCLWLSLFIPSLFAQIEWSDPIDLGYGSSPYLAIDRNTGYLHIVIKNESQMPPVYTGGVYYFVLDSLGNILHMETPVQGTEADQSSWDGGPCIAIDKNSTPHICFRQGNIWSSPYTVYYKRKLGSYFSAGWSNNVPIIVNEIRGFRVRMAVDSENIVHIVRGTQSDNIWGPIIYNRLWNGNNVYQQTIEPTRYRNDSSFSIMTDKDDHVHLVFGCPGLPENLQEGTIKYYRALPDYNDMFYVTDLQKSSGTGRTCSPDIFPDQAGFIHFSYGSNADAEAGGPVIRYARYGGNTILNDTIVTDPGELDPYSRTASWGISSVAASDDGSGVVVAFLTNPLSEVPGRLLTKMSIDSGKTWLPPIEHSADCGGEDGRNQQIIRAYKNHFYLVYPENGTDSHVKLRILMNGADGPPIAAMSGPSTGLEGQALTFDASASYDTGLTPRLSFYDWDWDQDGLIDLSSEAPVVEHTYADDFSGEIMLVVRDQWDQADTTYWPITIDNQAPTIEIGANRQCDEGETLLFESTVDDPGSLDFLTVTWQIDDDAPVTGESLSNLFRDEGTYTITATVTDGDGGMDQDALTVQVDNLSPAASMQIPHAGSTQMELTFQAQASDPGPDDVLTYKWDLNNDNEYEREGQTIVVTFAAEGLYPVSLRVSDGDGGFGYADDDLLIIDAPPEIDPLPGQTIQEGGTFQSLSLDDFVSDPVVENNQLTWNIAGSYDLVLQLNDRVLQAAVPDSEWAGQSNVMLICTNHINLKDTGIVVFNVEPVNDRPHWIAALPSYQFPEDDTLAIPLDSLRIRSADIDNPIWQLSYSIESHPKIHAAIDAAADQMRLWGEPDWTDETEVVFVVQDPDGRSDRMTVQIHVEGQPDDPLPFALLDPLYLEAEDWPDTLLFQWAASEDPDQPGSLIYEWTLEEQSGHPTAPVRQVNTTDTSLAFIPDAGLISGRYFWWVKAIAPSGNSTESDNIGFLWIGPQSSVEDEEAFMPDEFALFQNYPNPFNPETRITYHLAEQVRVSLTVYNARGQAVRLLADGVQDPGAYTVVWDSRDASGNRLPSGVYVYRLQAGKQVFHRKMLLIQ